VVLLTKASKVFSQFATAERKVAKLHAELGALLARPFINAGLYRFIETEIDAAVACEKLAAILADEKELATFRNEVSKRNANQARNKQKKLRTVASNKAGANKAATE